MRLNALNTSTFLTLTVLASSACLAGRPLSVDDANVNEVGAGHVEAWYARQAGGANVWTIAPAFALTEGVELAGSMARDATNKINTTAVQLKFRLTPSLKAGCNVGAAVGATQPNDGSTNTPYVNGLLSCNGEAGSLHLNLGAQNPPGQATVKTWGLAVEREFGAITGHLEYFGQQQSNPTVQAGLRTELRKNLQIDATVGQLKDESLFSLGLKFQF